MNYYIIAVFIMLVLSTALAVSILVLVIHEEQFAPDPQKEVRYSLIRGVYNLFRRGKGLPSIREVTLAEAESKAEAEAESEALAKAEAKTRARELLAAINGLPLNEVARMLNRKGVNLFADDDGRLIYEDYLEGGHHHVFYIGRNLSDDLRYEEHEQLFNLRIGDLADEEKLENITCKGDPSFYVVEAFCEEIWRYVKYLRKVGETT